MAKAYKNATPICIILTIVAALGIIFGLIYSQPLIPIILLLPATIYEVYRTEGKSTKAASWGMLGLLVAELIFVLFNINFDLAQFIGQSSTYIQGYSIPLGDIKLISPTAMAVLSIVLITNTRGRYTRWLAGIIFVTAFAIIYTLDPTIFQKLIRMAAREALQEL
jgi:hypothetical protein